MNVSKLTMRSSKCKVKTIKIEGHARRTKVKGSRVGEQLAWQEGKMTELGFCASISDTETKTAKKIHKERSTRGDRVFL
jgi:hypothetical protein